MAVRRTPSISSRKWPQQARSAELVSTILQAAIQVLTKEGAQRLTTARVAEKAGVSVGSLYQYFPNKAAILFRLQSDEWLQTTALLRGILEDTQRPPLERLRALVHAFIRSECDEAAMRVALNDAAPLYRDAPEAQEAIEESERRIRSIAIVHETLSREPGDEVRFDDIVQPLVRVVAETVTGPDRDLRLTVEGNAGMLPGDLATPLAVVLNELMQNAVDHAFTATDGTDIEGRTKGNITVQLARTDSTLVVDVVDDGVGLPPGFSVEQSGGLGLSIVHTLVTSELGGTIELRSDRGTRVHLTVPVRKPGLGTL